MGKKKNSWARQWMNQTDIGRVYGISAIAVGKRLVELEVKDEDGPTPEALAKGVATRIESNDGRVYFRWNRGKVLRMMDGLGLERLNRDVVRENKLQSEARGIARDMVRYWNQGEDKMASLLSDTLEPETRKRVEAELVRLGELDAEVVG